MSSSIDVEDDGGAFEVDTVLDVDVEVVEVEPTVVSVLDDEFDIGVVVVEATVVATVVGDVVAAVVAVRVSVVDSSG